LAKAAQTGERGPGSGREMGPALSKEAWAVSDLSRLQNHPGGNEIFLRWRGLDLQRQYTHPNFGTILGWMRSTLAHCALGSCEGMGLGITQPENAFCGRSYCTQTANGCPVHKSKSINYSSLQNPLLLACTTCQCRHSHALPSLSSILGVTSIVGYCLH